jgi:glyoxylase-like metal-dependent hydrolase (beta-lactamase superfamily II)
MGLYLRQLRAGRDYAKADRLASQMANFVYLIGDVDERVCMVVDPAWDVQGILDFIDGEDMKLTGALVTHYHPDHIGGNLFSHHIAGLDELLSLRPVRIYVNEKEAEGIKAVSGVSSGDLVAQRGGDEITIGKSTLRFLHTPGHTPGSQCFLVDGALVSGDTLFIGGCGRVDLPGSDATQMYYSLTQVLAKLPDETVLYPGHDYSSMPTSTMGKEKKENFYLKVPDIESWNRLMRA